MPASAVPKPCFTLLTQGYPLVLWDVFGRDGHPITSGAAARVIKR